MESKLMLLCLDFFYFCGGFYLFDVHCIGFSKRASQDFQGTLCGSGDFTAVLFAFVS